MWGLERFSLFLTNEIKLRKIFRSPVCLYFVSVLSIFVCSRSVPFRTHDSAGFQHVLEFTSSYWFIVFISVEYGILLYYIICIVLYYVRAIISYGFSYIHSIFFTKYGTDLLCFVCYLLWLAFIVNPSIHRRDYITLYFFISSCL